MTYCDDKSFVMNAHGDTIVAGTSNDWNRLAVAARYAGFLTQDSLDGPFESVRDTKYKAFITYSHNDAKVAARLQRALESYRVPARLIGKQAANGIIKSRIGAIFRDRDELVAGTDLGDSITRALADSEYLIVVCSPDAVKSRWVDQEIRAYKEIHGDQKILCYIVAGKPYARGDQAEEECFPEALGYFLTDTATNKVTEPVAADARPVGDGVKLAKLKIASALLGTQLDQLVQRDTQRRQRNLLIISMASVFGMVIMSMLSFLAIDARNQEQLRRAEAEGLIEFMLGDLRDPLDEVGRLDILDRVGERAIDYYSTVDVEDHTESSLGRRARAFHLLGEVDDLQGNMESARSSFDQAYQSTGELLERAPNDGERIFNHAQSVFWVGYLDWRLVNREGAESAFMEYLSLANRLVDLDPGRQDWIAETGHANINLGVYMADIGSPTEAISYFDEGRQVFQSLSEQAPENLEWRWQLAQSIAWLANANEFIGDYHTAREHRLREVQIYRDMQRLNNADQNINQALLVSFRSMAELSTGLGEINTAMDTFLESKEYGDELLELDPQNTFVAQEVAKTYARLSHLESYVSGPDQNNRYLERAETLIAQLLSRDASFLEWNRSWFEIQNIRAEMLIRDSQIDRAVAVLQQSIASLQRLIDENLESNDIRYLLARSHFYLGTAYESQGEIRQGSDQFAMAIADFESVVGDLPLQQKAVLSLAYKAAGDHSRADKLAAELADNNFRHPEYLQFL